jgi:nitrite reductase (NADH) large subunit
LSLRKRAGLKVPGRFDAWRLIHTLAGAIALLVLAAHSGFRVGHNLNLLLMACFSGVLVAGSIFGGMVAFGHRPAPVVASKLKSTFGWAHILLFWPLPVLLLFHVLKTYYY